jgi:hypothetical protein
MVLDEGKCPGYGLCMDKSSALQILTLDGSATRFEAKKAFRKKAKTCHPDRFANRPGAAEAEERMKQLNQAFALLMKVLPEKDANTGPVRPERAVRSGAFKGSFFSALGKRIGRFKKAGVEKKRRAHVRPGRTGARPGSGVTPKGSGQKARSPGFQGVASSPCFDHVLSGACGSLPPQSPCSHRTRRPAEDAYARYFRLKHHMRVQQRRPRQSTVSRVEKISPVRPVQRVGD